MILGDRCRDHKVNPLKLESLMSLYDIIHVTLSTNSDASLQIAYEKQCSYCMLPMIICTDVLTWLLVHV